MTEFRSITSDSPSGSLLTEKAAAERLNISRSLLRKMRAQRTGPPAIYVSPGTIRYKEAALRAWLESRPTVGEKERGTE